jgi:hypothetical protein
MKSDSHQQAVAVFTARESLAEILATLEKIGQAITRPTVIDILVNGNRTLLRELEAAGPQLMQALPAQTSLRVWWIALGNKAHAWNQYVATIWPETELTCFIDGYVSMRPELLALLEEALQHAPQTIAASGYPQSGRSSEQVQAVLHEDGGLHGNLFAINKATMQALRSRRIRLPLGLYGFDTVLGGILGYGLDPRSNDWDMRNRVATRPGIYWHVREKQWWNVVDVKTQFKRIINNALRVLVRKATIEYLSVQRMPPEQLPATIEAYILEWAQAHPEQLRRTLLASPLSLIPYRKLRKPRDWSSADLAPELRLSLPAAQG